MWLQHLLYCMLLYVIFKDPIQRWLDSRSWLHFLAACPVLSDVSGTVTKVELAKKSLTNHHQSSARNACMFRYISVCVYIGGE